MGDVEDADRLAHRRVLLEHTSTGVFQRHVPSAESGKLRT
jgi:hypothetical protein